MGYTSTPESSSCCIMCLAHTFMTVFFNNKNYGKLSPPPPCRCTMPRWKLLQTPTTTSWSEGWWHHPLPETAWFLRLKFFFNPLSTYYQGIFLDIFLAPITAQFNGDPCPRSTGCVSYQCLGIQSEPRQPQDKWSGKLHKSLHCVDLLSAFTCFLLDSAQTLLF